MRIEKGITINSKVDAVWEVLGNQFASIDKWASFISKSEVSGDIKETGTIRTTQTAKGPTQQQITAFNPENHSLSYDAIVGAPFFLENVKAKWSLTAIDENSTKLILDFSYDTKGIAGVILGPIAKMKLGKVGDELLDDFKIFVETGEPSGRKKAVMNY